MSLVNHGIPVVSARQWCTALSPNAAGDGWNYIVASSTTGTPPIEWNVIKDVTGVPVAASQQTFFTINGLHPNSNISLNSGNGQIRATNGRIFFPLLQNYFAYYDPTTEQIAQLGPFVESPPINIHASTIPFSFCFDTGGMLYFATQESENRPSCLVRVDPTTLAITVLGYVGSGALSYTTYGFRTVADTGTSTKFIYVAYGENPWQLWALNVTTGVSTKLYEVASTGNIQFSNIAGKGWTAIIDTNLGQPSNVRTQWWCLDGSIYAYTAGVDPPGGLARNVTPASNPLTTPPGIDDTGGTGIVGWRANGSSGAYTYVDYTVTYSAPVVIEALVTASDGIAGNAQQYNGVFQFHEPADTRSWWGPWLSGVSEPTWTNVAGTLYVTGYPNGALYSYDSSAAWNLGTNPPSTAVNPKYRGALGLNGTQYAGIKYSRCVAWSTAGAAGRVYVAGDRERNGSGCGVGYWDKQTGALAGVYSSADGSTGPASMSGALSTGLVVIDATNSVLLATKNISGTGTATLYVFDRSFALQATQQPIPNQAALGPIVATSNNNIIAGAYISGGFLNLYRWNVTTGQLVIAVETPYSGTIDAFTVNATDGSLWLSIAGTLVGVNPNTLLTKTADISSIAPAQCLAVYGTDMYMASGATVYSTPVPSTAFTVPQIDPAVLYPSGQIGRALGPPDFFDLLISTLNELCSNLAVTTLDGNLLRATAAVGKAQGIPTFYGTIVSTVNACATVLLQPLMDTNILNPSSKTSKAFSVPDFYAAVISKVNDLINHL